MAKKEIFCSVGVDVDAVAGQIGSYAGGESPSDISRGIFAAEIGSPRLVKLFDKMGMKTSWFIPGHSIETWPKQMKSTRITPKINWMFHVSKVRADTPTTRNMNCRKIAP